MKAGNTLILEVVGLSISVVEFLQLPKGPMILYRAQVPLSKDFLQPYSHAICHS